jgi:hypothetical protein
MFFIFYPKERYFVFITEMNRLTLFQEAITVRSKKYMKLKNKVDG